MLLKKRILPLALSVIMAVSALTGCGSSSEKDSSSGAETTLTMWTVSYTHLDVYKRQIEKLPKENPEYRFIEERTEELYKEYPKVMEVLDTEKPSGLSEQECKVLIEVLGLRNRISDMQQEAIYFSRCV